MGPGLGAARSMSARPPTDPARLELIRVGWRLRGDALLAEVMPELQTQRLEPILLKGAAFAHLLYDVGETRSSSDVDLLVEPERFDGAIAVLSTLGFRRIFGAQSVGPKEAHADALVRERDLAVIDLHRSLPLVGVDPAEAWGVLSARTTSLRVRATEVRIFDPAATALHAALHAALHGAESAKPTTKLQADLQEALHSTARGGQRSLEDLTRAAQRFDDETWRAAAALAARLDAEAGMACGLRLIPEGALLADRLGLSQTLPPEIASRHAILRLARERSWRARVAMAARLAFPPSAYMRFWFPLARSGRGGLLAAYGWRMARSLSRVGGIRAAWRRAGK